MGRNGSKLPAGRGTNPDRAGRGEGPDRDGRPSGAENAGLTLFSYLIAGMAAYGGIGWLIGHWTRHPLIFPIGMLVGLGLGIVAIMYRFGRS
jgi:F0F1-type ATP synthase assembly protein I